MPGAGPGSTPCQEGKHACPLTNACRGSATSPGTQKALEVVAAGQSQPGLCLTLAVAANRIEPAPLLLLRNEIHGRKLSSRLLSWQIPDSRRREGTSGDHLVQARCSSRGSQSRLPRAASTQASMISKDGASRTPLGNLFQGLTSLQINEFCITVSERFLCFSLCLLMCLRNLHGYFEVAWAPGCALACPHHFPLGAPPWLHRIPLLERLRWSRRQILRALDSGFQDMARSRRQRDVPPSPGPAPPLSPPSRLGKRSGKTAEGRRVPTTSATMRRP